jgi:hypothetical protein
MKTKGLHALLAVIGVLAGGMISSLSAAPVVSSGFDPAATLKAAVVFRNFSASGMSVGNGSVRLTNLSTNSDSNLTGGWQQSGGVNKVTFSYNGTSIIGATVDNGTPRGPFNFSTGSLGSLNYLQIRVQTEGSGRTVTFANVKVNGQAVGTFTAPLVQQWSVTGIDLTSGFTVEGDVILSGSHGGGDSTNIEVTAGHLPASDTEGPVTSNVNVAPQPVLLNGPAVVTATVSDAGKGDHAIASAQYSLNGGPWYAMSAADGAFDQVSEDVTATIASATQIGVNNVCVRGTDALGNTGGSVCQSFVVDYSFHGFLSPIDMGISVVNKARGGQAVPAKWRLTDANGAPVADPGSFEGFYSYEVSCSEFTADPVTSVLEVAPGQSSLQYLGDGYWQFNWKTPKEYEGTCLSSRSLLVPEEVSAEFVSPLAHSPLEGFSGRAVRFSFSGLRIPVRRQPDDGVPWLGVARKLARVGRVAGAGRTVCGPQ